jgi:hypothetical protein
MRTQDIQAAMAVVAFLASTLAGAAAQQVERSPQAIQKCLCMEQMVATLNTQVQAQSRSYEDKRQVFQALDNQVRTSRSEVNVNNQADVDAFRRLLERRDEAADTLAGATTNSYAEAVARYNESVAAYNDQCSGKAYDADQLAQIRGTLNCPK